MQQITSQGIIDLQAWVKIQEKVNVLAENNQLIDKQQKTLRRSHQNLKGLPKLYMILPKVQLGKTSQTSSLEQRD